MKRKSSSEEEEDVRAAILKKSVSSEEEDTRLKIPVKGYDFNNGVNYSKLIDFMASTGFQATHLGDAFNIVNHMLDWRLSHENVAEDCSEEEKNPSYRESVKCKIFLGFSSNLISSGLRDIIRYLAQHRMVEVIVTEAGGIVEDLIKCLADTYRGEFSLPGAALRKKRLNRYGNLLVPEDNYCKFQDWINPILDQMLEEQKTQNLVWTPSKVIARLGKEINDKSSYLYWAYKNDIPVFLTEGFLGKAINDHYARNPGLVIDVVQDTRAINDMAVHANTRKTGMIILGGLPKYKICNENMMPNGADYVFFINTAQEFDGSDSGARPDEAVSWGSISSSAESVKVHCDATIAFPLLVAKTFAAKREKPSESGSDVIDIVRSVVFEESETIEAPPAKRKKVAQPRSDVIDNVPSVVLRESESLEDTYPKIKGYDFNNGVNYSELLKSMGSTGFQASNLGDAIDTVNQMLDWRLSHEQVTQDCSDEEKNPTYRESVKCKIFLGFTSNLISSGLRDIIRYLVQHHMVDAIVTTTGGIEEDLIKCLADTYIGDFSLSGATLRLAGLNRTGNLLTPNDNYCKFEDRIIPIFNELLEEQKTKNVLWTPSKVIARLGKEIDNESSYLYWAYKNNIPVFCPGPTDGSLGDMLYLHSFHNPDLVIDVVQEEDIFRYHLTD